MHVPTSLKDKKFYILPTEYLYILYVSQKKNTLKFFVNGTRLFSINEETSVHYAVRAGSLNKIR